MDSSSLGSVSSSFIAGKTIQSFTIQIQESTFLRSRIASGRVQKSTGTGLQNEVEHPGTHLLNWPISAA